MDLSIVTINYNNLEGIKLTFKSVFEQTAGDFEYIVIDGGSTDGSVEYINQFQNKVTRFISEKDKGIYDAINKGIVYSNGKYLMFLNSGDCLCDSETIGNCLKEIKLSTSTDVFYGNILFKRQHASDLPLHIHPSKLDISFFESNNINHQASLINSNLFEEFGLYPLNYKLASDHWLNLKCIIENKKFSYINRPLVIYDFTGESSKRRDEYDEEMKSMWEIMVPAYVQNVSKAFNEVKINTSSKAVRAALWFNKKIMRLKQRGTIVNRMF